MSLKNKTIALTIICSLLVSTFAIFSRNPVATAQDDAELTGNIVDGGKDTDSNGKYDYLEVAVEINVSISGIYRITASYLMDNYSTYLYSYTYNESSLSTGLQWLNLSFYGPAIYGMHFNPYRIPQIDLYWGPGGFQYIDAITDVPLSRVYDYAEFDCAATLTGIVHDQGVDTNSNGLFDMLQLGIEVNVLRNATYTVSVSGLHGDLTYVPFYDSSSVSLATGLQTVNFSVYGPTIFSDLRRSAGNISAIYSIDLSVGGDQASYQIDGRYDTALSRSYAYFEFESHAYFTESIFDNGVDRDADGLFNSLAVSAEVNVTKAGKYTFSVEGLEGLKNGTLTQISDYQSLDLDLDVGVHLVNFSFLGQMIAYNRFDPTNITGLRLAEESSYDTLSYTYAIDLPTKYSYTQFNAPFTDTELEFMVYPNATICVKGNQSQTHMYPLVDDARINATVGFSTSGDVTTGWANGTMVPPTETESEWPINSLTASLLANYYNDVLNAQLNATVLMQPEMQEEWPINFSSSDLTLDASYSNGIVAVDLSGASQVRSDLAEEFPFNVSDLRLVVDYVNKRVNGNVTFHVLGGFPLGDVVTDIDGDESDVSLSGSVNVTYSNLFGDPIGESNVTDFIDFLNGLTGVGDGSLYNVTNGMVDFVSLDTTRTPQSWGEIVEYNALLHGNLTGGLGWLLANMTFSADLEPMFYAALNSTFSSVQNGTLWLNYYNASKTVTFDLQLYSNVKTLWNNAVDLIPSTLPDDSRSQIEAMLGIANATAYALNDAHVQATYSGELQELDLTASIEVNATQLKNDIVPFIPNATLNFLPPEFGDMFESYMNTTYCKLDTLTFSASFDGIAHFDADWVLQGDFKAQVNHAKGFLGILNSGMSGWTINFLNSTEIDIDNLILDVKQGEDWSNVMFDGVKVYPSRDEIDPIRFTLLQWLNMTNDPEAPPKDFERFKVALTGGFNGTHTILLYSPGTIPDHTTALDYKTMIWQNVSLGSLRDLLFQVAYQGVVDHLGHTYYVPIFTNSTIDGFGFDSGLKSLSFNVGGDSGTGFCNVTVPRELLYAAPGEWVVKVDDVPIAFDVAENSGYVFIYFNYSHSAHAVEIRGTWIVTEYQPNLLPPIMVILVLVAAIAVVKQRKKLAALKTRYQSAISNLVARKLRELGF